MIETWQNESGAAPRVNAGRPLTHSLDRREEGLAMQATRVCSVAECDKPWSHRDWCENHYRRWLEHGDPLAGRLSPTGSPCSIEGCERPNAARTWCALHYGRWQRTGRTDPPPPRVTKPCAIEGCDRTHSAYGWCNLHYERWFNTGDPLDTLSNNCTVPGVQNVHWRGDAVSYHGMHTRLRRLGPARLKTCVDCGDEAAHWSYDHKDPDELIEPPERGGKPYSVKMEHYEPRCRSCHATFDNRARR